LGFEQFEEQNPIDPGDRQFERHVEQAVLRGAAKLIQVAQTTQFIQAIELNNSIFEDGTGVSVVFLVALDEFFAALFGFREPNDVEQFAVKTLVETVAVVGKRFLEQMFGREQFEERNQFVVVAGVVVTQRFLVVLQIEIRKFNFGADLGDKRLGNLLVEKIGFGL
jgi:hypothetical protein